MKFLPVMLLALCWGMLVACRDDVGPPPLDATPVASGTALSNVGPTPTLNQVAQATATKVAKQTPTAPPPTATPTITSTPTDPPTLRERLELAERALFVGDYAQAVEHFGAVVGATGDEGVRSEARLNLGISHFANENYTAARAILNQSLSEDEPDPLAFYFRAQTSVNEGNCDKAFNDYATLLQLMPEIKAYIYGWMAECYVALGDTEQAIAHYELAQLEDAHHVTTYQQRSALAQFYRDAQRFEDSAELYATMRQAARTNFTKGETGYLQAQVLIQSGDIEGGFDIYRELLESNPTQYTTYLGLIELVTGGAIVDQFQRGLIDYHADAYIPCIDAFVTYLAQNQDDFDPEALLYLAWCYEGAGNFVDSAETFDTYAALSANTAGEGLLEKGNMYRRQGNGDAAIDVYAELVETLPTDEHAGTALYWTAVLRDLRGETDEAIALYQQLGRTYPENERTPQGMFRAGFLANIGGEPALAQQIWRDAAAAHPDDDHGEAALVWLLAQNGLNADDLALAEQFTLRPAFYSARLADQVTGVKPFGRVPSYELVLDRDSAETELKALLDIDPNADIGTLPNTVQNDPHLIRAERLWQLRRFEEAKFELEFLRTFYADNVLVSYQLANYFREIGLYRSMILAAEATIRGLDLNPFTAPKYLAGLAYPVEYSDLILPLAEQYGYDPFVQFALVRQESLYESFATSFAAAQGLAQVIPDTGYYIAEKLAWPNYVNEDLYKPYVGLQFGAFYLDEQLNYFGRSIHPALAAYNAGPGNAFTWWNAAGDDVDAYTETINFSETRLYIEKIYTGHAIYRHLYGVGQPEQAEELPFQSDN